MPSQLVHVRLPDSHWKMLEEIREQNKFISDQEAIRHSRHTAWKRLPFEVDKPPKNKSKKSAKTS
jgi:Arc/MetJ-type ribon-helix-helix transcriptional regulator